jgi:hypothetical protein
MNSRLGVWLGRQSGFVFCYTEACLSSQPCLPVSEQQGCHTTRMRPSPFCRTRSVYAGPLVFLTLGLGAYLGYTQGGLSGKQAAKGRWVYDRSLGGKKV